MSNQIKTARKTIREAFERDPNFRHAYICRIGMWLYDEQARGEQAGGKSSRGKHSHGEQSDGEQSDGKPSRGGKK